LRFAIGGFLFVVKDCLNADEDVNGSFGFMDLWRWMPSIDLIIINIVFEYLYTIKKLLLMFGLFNKKDPNRCPVTEENRIWIETSFNFLLNTFDKQKIKEREILIPHHSHFPIRYNGSDQTAIDTLAIVAKQMEVNPDDIHLDFYSEGPSEISTGASLGAGRVFLNSTKDDKRSAGLYLGKQEDGKYHILLERGKILEPENMVATLAHEIAHIKLLGEGNLTDNDEKLTDLTTIIFGLGVFSANSAFQSYSGFDFTGWQKLGYLTQMEWGYGLALLAYIRKEKSPDWIKHLTLNVKSDFKLGMSFIENNEALINL